MLGRESSRVYIKSVTCAGFKSFGDTKQTFSFGPGLNLIAGPNGAGKSNILDAVSFALCAKSASLRVQHLSELQSTDTDEPCQIKLEIASYRNDGNQRVFTLEARILPDSTRQYKLDGKLKTMKDVKEFLRDHHLLLDEAFAILQQAKVTELADTNSPVVIASIISSASGAGRWNEEVSRAVEEVSNTRKGLATINQNISVLEKAIASDKERVQAMDRQKEIDYEIEDVQRQLRIYARKQLTCLENDTDDIVEQLEMLEKKRVKLLGETSTLKSGLPESDETGDETLELVAKERLELLQKMAQAEEELRIEEKRAEQGKAAALQLQQLRVRIQRLTEVHEQAVRTLKEKQAAVVRLEQERTRFACLGNTAASKRHVQDLVNELEEEIRAAETALERQEGSAKEAAAAVTEMQFARDKLQEKVQSDRKWLKASEEERAAEEKGRAELNVQIERLTQEKGELERDRDGMGRKARVAAALLGRMSEQEERIPAWSLHSLFRFKSDAGLECEQYLEALNAVAGSLQSVCVVNTTRDATRLLSLWQSTVSDSPFRRIWPLDRLTSPDLVQKQRRIQNTFKPGEVMLPLDFLDFDPKFAQALNKAFGGYVIAANDRVARDLIANHGLWNVTLDGKVSRTGSVQGGWRGAGGSSFMKNKYNGDALLRQLESLQKEANAIDQQIERMSQQDKHLADKMLEAEARVRTHRDEENQLQRAEMMLFKVKLARDECDKRLETLLQEIGIKKERLRQYIASETSGSEEETLAKALDAAIDDETAQENVVNEAWRELEEAKESEEALKDEVDLASSKDVQERLGNSSTKLAALRQDLARVEDLQASHAQEQEKRAEERSKALKRAQACDEEMKHCEKVAEKLKKQKEQMEKKQQALEEEIASLADDCEDDRETAEEDGSIENDKQCAAAKARQRHLLSEKKRLSEYQQRVTMDEQVAFKERVDNLQVFKERAASILQSIEKLNEGIRTTRDKVQKANEATFNSIRTSFIDCCKSLLPDKRVDLVKVKDHVEEGVRFLFQNANVDVASGRPRQGLDWKSNLGELSGGQRTMLSLAFILTVAMNGRSSLYIMDEVDAALDEQNQRRVAALVKDVIAKESQVLCVSHNRSFQMFSDTVIQLSRREGSSKAEAVLTAGVPKKKHRQT